MDVEAGRVLVAHAVAAHIGFVRQNQCGGHCVHRVGGLLIVVPDGGDDGRHFIGGRPHLVQDAESHDRTALGVVVPVDDIADVMHPACDGGQFRGTCVVAEGEQDLAGQRGNTPRMGIAVLRIPQRGQAFVCFADVAVDLFALFDLFQIQWHISHRSL